MKIQFVGADRTVTGSLHYFEVNGSKFILDCGLIQGKRKESFELNRTFEFFDPKDLDFVILSHAHIDHAGNLPNLVKRGFAGKIYCTHATKSLSEVMLLDSAYIQEKDVEFVNKRRRKQGKNLFEPLYTVDDAKQALSLLFGLNYHHDYEITPEITLNFFDAGHILGSAIVFLNIKEDGKITNLAFTGDLGRKNLPILQDPDKIPDVDFLICESTYGGRFHDSFTVSQQKLADVVVKAVSRNAKIIVPSFSVGRTQELVYLLHKIFNENQAPEIPVYVDSPLSVNATEVFRKHTECFDAETTEFLLNHEDPFGFNKLRYISDVEDSKRLNGLPGPMMIISSSGMAEAGRILHHLANNIEDPNNIILIVGFNAEHTLGRKIVERQPVVKIFGDEYEVKAEVIVFNSLSAHADSNELIDYVEQLDKNRMQKIFLVHGDYDQQLKFAERLKTSGFKDIVIPERGDVFEI